MPSRILVVDDDPIIRDLFAEMLSRENFIVICVEDGRQAEEQIHTERPDLILLDADIPHRNGFDICTQLKQNPETMLIPIVMVTGLKESRDRIRGLEAGADDFLSKPMDLSELKARVHSLLKRKEYTDELDRAESVLISLGRSIEAKDPYTRGHCERISQYSALLGNALDLPLDDIRALKIAGSVHDLGKVAVPDAILLKNGALLPEEWEVMRQHTTLGERICQPLNSFQKVLPIIRCHHEKQNGTGYPDGLCGEEIPLLARILQTADVFDALTTERPYKRAFSPSEAIDQMKREVEMGWWDPKIFSLFAEVLEQEGLPSGSDVRRGD
jgi:putative two-component system response regulator